MSDNRKNSESLDDLDWVRFREDLYKGVKVETFSEKFVRKVSENPAVPLGTLATVIALSLGLYNFHKGNTVMSQYMMRARVGAQAFTILSMVAGFLLVARKEKI
ncbi:HIG1 domain family member 2A, mitochondrial [Ceratina calcarata]|uniref:HIG1 domain family member 2A, mitochondrial n=1 Tax=Ceratina calcarata TaxID=156304 RepID=A0AAJ7J820_9HYME|nr:HIG1 domain family member 2A, mitochondrial [Ceratina calcarata]